MDDKLSIESEKEEFIDLKIDKSLFFQENNFEKLKIAKRRFNKYVYLDKNNKYQVSLEDGKKINVSNDLFEFLKKALSLRHVEKKSESRALPIEHVDPFAVFVVGDLKAKWEYFVGHSYVECQEVIEECWQYMKGMVLAFVAFANGSFFIEAIKDPNITPGHPYKGIPLAENAEFRSKFLSDGLYPHPFRTNMYIAIRNGLARSYYTDNRARFDWDRDARPKFYPTSHADLAHDWEYYWSGIY